MHISPHWRPPPLQDESELPLGLALPALSVAAPLAGLARPFVPAFKGAAG